MTSTAGHYDTRRRYRTLYLGWTDNVAFEPDGTLVVTAGNDLLRFAARE